MKEAFNPTYLGLFPLGKSPNGKGMGINMRDSYGREINYMRISITDRCNFHCRYCMPDKAQQAEQGKLLTYEEIRTICRIAVSKGIRSFKITGGEPLVRKGCVDFLRSLKAMEGVVSVTLTTNGALLAEVSQELSGIGIDGVNISLDALEEKRFDQITGTENRLPKVLSALERLQKLGVKTKINAVLLEETTDQLIPLAALARNYAVDVKFIEIMPLGPGRDMRGLQAGEALRILKSEWPDLSKDEEIQGNGPAVYYRSASLRGALGLIHAVSEPFCQDCNRLRLTSRGILKPCLCYGGGVSLRELLAKENGEEAVGAALERAVWDKPKGHCFENPEGMTEQRGMREIGG